MLGEVINKLRVEKGISTRDLEKITGISNSYISQIERGHRNPTAEILIKIAKALDVSKLYLFREAGFLNETDILNLLDENKKLREALESACESLGADVEDYL